MTPRPERRMRHVAKRNIILRRLPTQTIPTEDIERVNDHTIRIHGLTIFPTEVVELSIIRQTKLDRQTLFSGMITVEQREFSADLYEHINGTLHTLHIREVPDL